MKKILFILVCFICQFMRCQRNAGDFAVINVGLQGMVSGVGAVLNKTEQDKLGRTFLKGFLGGCAAGTFMYSGKLLIGNISKESNLLYAWPGKITYWAGNSIAENAALNRPLFDQYNVNIGIFRLEYKISLSDFKVKVLPLTSIITVYIATKSKFEFEKSLATGELIFSSSKFNLNTEFRGFALGNIVVLQSKNSDSYSTISHEIIHIAQNNDFNFVNTWINPILNRNSFFKKTSPFIYYEFNTILNQVLYWTQYKDYPNYYRNIFESEAATFSHTFRD